MLIIIFIFLYLICCYLFSKFVYLLLQARYRQFGENEVLKLKDHTVKTMIVMGSGWKYVYL